MFHFNSWRLRMKRWAILVILLAAGLMLRPLQLEPAAGQSGARITVQSVVVSGLTQPVTIAHAGDGSNRLFVVEKPGRIRVVKNGVLLPAPFLDVSSLVSTGSEQGLLGLAFHPQYKTNGLFYIYYTDKVEVGNTVVARYAVSAGNSDLADPATRQQLLYAEQPFANHNAGHMAFGPDGYLYIAIGDGGSGGDPGNNAQRTANLLGKILRIDVNSGSPYVIPPTNPFINQPGARPEIWAYGLRNPWKFSFDRLTGDLYIGDVGQNKWEEISFQPPAPGGVNFGWRCMEGSHQYTSVTPCNLPAYLGGLTGPIAEYGRSLGVSVTGGYVYRGTQFPELAGRYFYGDFGTGRIWSLAKTASNPAAFSAPLLELENTGLNISAFGEDEAGELYLADFGGGTVRRLQGIHPPGPDLIGSRIAPNASSANHGETVPLPSP
jgi:glucose/arabinose dehydrogenase